MENHTLNFSQLQHLFNITDSRDSFYSMADSGQGLPQPIKKQNGFRYWTPSMLPEIAQKYMTLSSPKSNLAPVISFYLSKGGGSHKTTDAYNLACYLGMAGKKVLVIGLDFQLNISKKLGIDNSRYNINQTGEYNKGLYEVMVDNSSWEESIHQTSAPNVWLVPESSNLVKLEVWLTTQVKREEKLQKAIEPLRKEFDAIIIDNNPSWSQLSISSLCACTVNIASIGLDANTNEALPQFFETLEFSGIQLEELILVPGLFEKRNALKKGIYEHLKNMYGNMLTEKAIRKSTAVDEANATHIPVFLYKPKDPVAEDYLDVCEEIWDRAVIALDNTENYELESL